MTPGVHFPFLTCQWKSPIGSHGQWHAQRQSARDGAAIVNYLHDFYTKAGFDPTVVDTCHWSVTCDMMTAMLWVHWRTFEAETGAVEHHMQMVDQQFLRAIDDSENTAMVNFRRRLRNVLDYAVGPRLIKIKAAIPSVELAEDKNPKHHASITSRKSQPSKPPSDQGYGGSPDSFPGPSATRGLKRKKI